MSSSIDDTLVRHVAKLARIAVTDEQTAALGSQLGAILSYFDKLKELDTERVEPMAHPLDFRNVLADDQLGQSLTREQALANAPQRDECFFLVPKVIGDSQ
jgi:aspartyl-tRNA(Asn)/glutamyl-tRNA(Gln) amidotransferase subunit C